ncbi:MAG: hypothetical protein CML98_06090 [Rhodobiaceae bacterium]|nr:hypothetical protein [Rhodobiaceae bacterium]|tara:strand:+ start:19195 stop:19980 length:786 start_codon:yes stop_codon:yes gene_type:complete
MSLAKYSRILFLCLLILPSCGSSLKEFVSSSTTGSPFQAGPPDEFLTVTKKPLIMPPDYLLRPPSDEDPAFLINTREEAKLLVLGEEAPSSISRAEEDILLMANSKSANPNIKKELYAEEGAIKDENLTEYLARLKDENAQALDLEEEFERLNTREIIGNKIMVENEEKNSIKVEALSLNRLMLKNLQETDDISGKSKINYELSIDDIIDLDGKENSNSGSETEFESSVDTTKRDEIPPVDRMPTVFKGLMGGIASGFGLF